MSVEVIWRCDDCDETFTRPIDEPLALKTPEGWTARRYNDRYLHACPSCTRDRHSVGWD